MRKLFFLIICFNIFSNEHNQKNKVFQQVFHPNLSLGVGKIGEDNDNKLVKADTSVILITYKGKSNYFGDSGLGFGLGASYIINQERIVYIETAYGHYDALQTNVRIRVGLDSNNKYYYGFRIIQGLFGLTIECGADYLKRGNEQEMMSYTSIGFGF